MLGINPSAIVSDHLHRTTSTIRPTALDAPAVVFHESQVGDLSFARSNRNLDRNPALQTDTSKDVSQFSKFFMRSFNVWKALQLHKKPFILDRQLADQAIDVDDLRTTSRHGKLRRKRTANSQ